MDYKKIVDTLVSNGANNIKKKVVTLNNNQPIFNKQDFDIFEGIPKYFGIDRYNRITGGIAMLSKNTIPKITEKKLEYPRPYGWTKKLEKTKGLFESCHIIAYNLSAQNVKKENLFIGTNDLNTSIMKEIENDVNRHIKNNNFNVLYKVTIKYKGTNQIPTGILIEAQAINDKFSVCKFCYNIEKLIKFDYKDGTIIYNHNYINKAKETIINFRNRIVAKDIQKKNEPKETMAKHNYVLNISTNECHYCRQCDMLQNTDPKYIQETRTTEKVIINNKFKICDKCIKGGYLNG